MYAILAEDESDVDTLKVLIRRIANDNRISIKGKGFGGCGEMLKNGAEQLIKYKRMGTIQRYIICHDSDRKDIEIIRKDIIAKIIGSGSFNYVLDKLYFRTNKCVTT